MPSALKSSEDESLYHNFQIKKEQYCEIEYSKGHTRIATEVRRTDA